MMFVSHFMKNTLIKGGDHMIICVSKSETLCKDRDP